MEDELIFEDSLPEELSYLFASREIQLKIMKSWKELKLKLNRLEDEDLLDDIEEFDKLLNYFL